MYRLTSVGAIDQQRRIGWPYAWCFAFSWVQYGAGSYHFRVKAFGRGGGQDLIATALPSDIWGWASDYKGLFWGGKTNVQSAHHEVTTILLWPR